MADIAAKGRLRHDDMPHRSVFIVQSFLQASGNVFLQFVFPGRLMGIVNSKCPQIRSRIWIFTNDLHVNDFLTVIWHRTNCDIRPRFLLFALDLRSIKISSLDA